MKAVDQHKSHRQVQTDGNVIPSHIETPTDAHRHPKDGSRCYHPPWQAPPKTAVRDKNFILCEQYKRLTDDLVE